MASRDRRRRELARTRYERQEQRRLDRERTRRRRQRILVGVVVGVLVLGMGVGLIVALATRSDEVDTAAATPPVTADPAGSCVYTDDGSDPALVTDVGRPPAEPGDLGPLTAVVTIGGRPVTIELDTQGAPCTSSSWQFLAAADFFDGTTCHRLTTSDTLGVLQCGDPSGTGRGGPGYRLAEENLEGATYGAGTVAMANTGQTGSTGSQFFIVHSDSVLLPDYTVVGTVVDGLDVVTDIAAAGTVEGTTDGAPADEVVIDDLVVERSGS